MTADNVQTRPVPVTLITGFLGAGKTTLVNSMLRNAEGLRLAVLVNDFGAVNIDAELIEGAAEDVIALKNGCICCSLAGGLLAAISGVLRRPDPPDAIIIEGSGVTDPLEVARALSDPELQRYAPMDGIVTVVDAMGIANLDGDALTLALRQVSTADLVLLNKIDLADQEALGRTEQRLMALASGVRIVHCTNAQVPLAVLLGLATTRPVSGSESGGIERSSLAAADAFESLVVEQTQPIRMQQIHDLLSRLPERAYRVKGFLHLVERPDVRCILQATGRRATITVGEPWGASPPTSRIVFIAAKGVLDRSQIEMQLGDASKGEFGPGAVVA